MASESRSKASNSFRSSVFLASDVFPFKKVACISENSDEFEFHLLNKVLQNVAGPYSVPCCSCHRARNFTTLEDCR